MIEKLKNINFLKENKYTAIDNPAEDELWFVERDLDGDLAGKADNLSYTGNTLALKSGNTTLNSVTIKSAPDVDNKSINFDGQGNLQTFAIKTANGTYLAEWIGTQSEYDTALASGVITQNTACFITDDQLTQIVNIDDEKVVLQGYVDRVQALVDTIDARYVKVSGNQSISDIKTFESGLRVANTDSSFKGITGCVGANDNWRVGGGATGSNAGYMEIATSDDGTEPIYVRQYNAGGGAWGFNTLARTATLLDASGNTSFPGTLNVGGGCTLAYNNGCLEFIF